MESNARRRLDRIYRHFLDSRKLNDVLQPELLSNGRSKNVEAVIIGGMVLDIHATTSLPTTPRTTTPGMVNYVLGGVARNIAECVSKLGTKPFMISVLGDDMAGNLLLEHWKSSKLSTEGIQKRQQIKTAVVINIFDNKGEVAAGVASVEAIEKFLTPNWIHKFKDNISSAPLLMVDANLNLPALEFSCQIAAESNIPVWFEPVSVAKSRRIVSIAKYVHFASPNEAELIAMANAVSGRESFAYTLNDNHSPESLFHTLKPAIWALLRSGVKILVVTLGPNGVFLCCEGGPGSMTITKRSSEDSVDRLFAVHFPALSAAVMRLTGAGDCLVGGAISSICDGSEVMMSIAVGIAASKAAVEAETNVPSSFDLAAIVDDARLVYARSKVICHESMR